MAQRPTGRRWAGRPTPRRALHCAARGRGTSSHGTTHRSRCATAAPKRMAGPLPATPVSTAAAEQTAVCRPALPPLPVFRRVRSHTHAHARARAPLTNVLAQVCCLDGSARLQTRSSPVTGCASCGERAASQSTIPRVQTVARIQMAYTTTGPWSPSSSPSPLTRSLSP